MADEERYSVHEVFLTDPETNSDHPVPHFTVWDREEGIQKFVSRTRPPAEIVHAQLCAQGTVAKSQDSVPHPVPHPGKSAEIKLFKMRRVDGSHLEVNGQESLIDVEVWGVATEEGVEILDADDSAAAAAAAAAKSQLPNNAASAKTVTPPELVEDNQSAPAVDADPHVPKRKGPK